MQRESGILVVRDRLRRGSLWHQLGWCSMTARARRPRLNAAQSAGAGCPLAWAREMPRGSRAWRMRMLMLMQ